MQVKYDKILDELREQDTIDDIGAMLTLSTTSGIDATNTVTPTTLFTVPAGMTAIITAIVIRCTSVTLTVTAPATAGVGANGGVNDIMFPVNLINLLDTTGYWGWYIDGKARVCIAGNVIKFGITNAATGPAGFAQELAVDLIGYLF